MTNKSDQDFNIEQFQEAVAATVRALSKRSDLDVHFTATEIPDKPSLLTDFQIRIPKPDKKLDEKNISLIRGAADTRALRLLYTNPETLTKNAPSDLMAQEVYKQIEQARVEALGSMKLAGIKQNLNSLLEEKCKRLRLDSISSAEDLSQADALYLMARVQLSDIQPPVQMQKLYDMLSPEIEAAIGKEGFSSLKPYLSDQSAFSSHLSSILKKLGLPIDGLSTNDHEENRDSTSQDDSDDDVNEEQSDGSEEQSQDEATDNGSEEGDNDDDLEQENAGHDDVNNSEDGEFQQDENSTNIPTKNSPSFSAPSEEGLYTIYTDQFDETVRADELAESADLDRLRTLLDQQLSHLQGVIGRLANRLQRKLMAQQRRSWEFDLEEGYIDSHKLARVVANPTVPLSFKQEKDNSFRDTIVTLLIDNSGSMRGRPIATAAMCTDILARTLERCQVKVEILGFTTRAWKGGKSREMWVQDGRPEKPGRLNDLRHIIYKAADEPMRRARRNIALMLKEGLLKENIDGEALHWAYNRLAPRSERRKILIVISDGAPVDDSTLSVNPSNYLEMDLRNIINWIENDTPIEMAAIGIGHDVTRYYKNSITIRDAAELAEALAGRLEELFSDR